MKNKFLRCLVWYPIHPFIMAWYFICGFFNWNYDEPTSHCIKCKAHYRNKSGERYSEGITFDHCPHCIKEMTIDEHLKVANDQINRTNKYAGKKLFNDDFVLQVENQIISEKGVEPEQYRREKKLKEFDKVQEVRNKKLERLFKEDE